jgi:hypothetical protein
MGAQGSSLRRPSFSGAIDFRLAKSMSCVTAMGPGCGAISLMDYITGRCADLHTALCASVSRKNGIQADRRVSSGPRPNCEVRVLSTTSRSVGWTWLGAVTTVTRGPDSCSCSSAFAGIGASNEARNCQPESVMHQPRSSRSTNESAKISSFGARAANRRIRSVQSDPLDIRTLT